jgi:hypothetical protein
MLKSFFCSGFTSFGGAPSGTAAPVRATGKRNGNRNVTLHEQPSGSVAVTGGLIQTASGKEGGCGIR